MFVNINNLTNNKLIMVINTSDTQVIFVVVEGLLLPKLKLN